MVLLDTKRQCLVGCHSWSDWTVSSAQHTVTGVIAALVHFYTALRQNVQRQWLGHADR